MQFRSHRPYHRIVLIPLDLQVVVGNMQTARERNQAEGRELPLLRFCSSTDWERVRLIDVLPELRNLQS